jgi:tetratricopeptide (TPR) repeat protein
LIKIEQERHAEALSYYEKALEIWRKTLPANHPSLAQFYNNIGGVYYSMGKCTKALSYLATFITS